MPKSRRGPWSAADTREVLLQAAWDCLRTSVDRSDVSVVEILQRASEIWTRRRGDSYPREFTRGSITANWRSLDEFYDEALAAEFELSHGQSFFPFEELISSIEALHRSRPLRALRLDLTNLLSTSVERSVLADTASSTSTLNRLRILSGTRSPTVAAMFRESDELRRRRLTAVYVQVVEIARWHQTKPHALAQSHLAILDGSTLQLALNPSLDRAWVAQIARDSVVATCERLNTQHESSRRGEQDKSRRRLGIGFTQEAWR